MFQWGCGLFVIGPFTFRGFPRLGVRDRKERIGWRPAETLRLEDQLQMAIRPEASHALRRLV